MQIKRENLSKQFGLFEFYLVLKVMFMIQIVGLWR